MSKRRSYFGKHLCTLIPIVFIFAKNRSEHIPFSKDNVKQICRVCEVEQILRGSTTEVLDLFLLCFSTSIKYCFKRSLLKAISQIREAR